MNELLPGIRSVEQSERYTKTFPDFLGIPSHHGKDDHRDERREARMEPPPSIHQKLRGLFVDQWQPLQHLYCQSAVDAVPRERLRSLVLTSSLWEAGEVFNTFGS